MSCDEHKLVMDRLKRLNDDLSTTSKTLADLVTKVTVAGCHERIWIAVITCVCSFAGSVITKYL